jgi:hypothetical protein
MWIFFFVSFIHSFIHSFLCVRLSVQNFWRAEQRLPVTTVDRLCALLEALHSPSTENCYLAYATDLLLEVTSRSPDFNRAVFEHPLSQCKFQVPVGLFCFVCSPFTRTSLYRLMQNFMVKLNERSEKQDFKHASNCVLQQILRTWCCFDVLIGL